MDQNDKIHAKAQYQATLAIEEWHELHRGRIAGGAGLAIDVKQNLVLTVVMAMKLLIAAAIKSAEPTSIPPKPAARKRKTPKPEEAPDET